MIARGPRGAGMLLLDINELKCKSDCQKCELRTCCGCRGYTLAFIVHGHERSLES